MSHPIVANVAIGPCAARPPHRNRSLFRTATCVLAALVPLATPAVAFERIDAITLENGESALRSAVIDPTGGFAYFGTGTYPGRVAKIDLATFERVDGITLASGENDLFSAVIDPAGDFAYFGTSDGPGTTPPGRVVKIDLETFQRVDAITLESGESGLSSAVIDPEGDFAYFGTNTSPGRIVKIDLATFERVEAIALESGEEFLSSAVIDPAGAFAYFGAYTTPGRVVKIDLATFERVEAITPESDDGGILSAVIDPAGKFAYFGTQGSGSPAFAVKIDLATFERVDSIALESSGHGLFSAVIDSTGEFAYFGAWSLPGRVTKIDLESFDDVETITLESGESILLSGAIDAVDEFAYFGTYFPTNSPGRIVKIAVAGEPAPELAFDPASLDFGAVVVSETSPPQVSTLANTSAVDATGLDFSLSGRVDFDFDAGDCGGALSAGESCEVSVTLTPSTAGPVAATLTVAGDQGVLASLGLSGGGIAEGEGFTAVGLVVDPEALALSDGNRVFELGETVEVAPAWRNDDVTAKPLTGAASDFTGPGTVDYTLVADTADYGLVDPGATTSCLDTGTCYQLGLGPVGAARPATHWHGLFVETLAEGAEGAEGNETATQWALHIGDSFTDVQRSSPFYRWVETMLHHEVTGGCGATTYCPAGTNSRGQMPVFVLKALEGAGYVPPACVEGDEAFGDVAHTSPFCPWITELANRGVVAGCGNGNYCPSAAVTRGQMAIFLLKTLEGSGYSPPPCGGLFADVACPSPFAAWIEELAARGITGGCSAEPLAYCPGTPVTRQQMAVFVSRTFGLTLYGP